MTLRATGRSAIESLDFGYSDWLRDPTDDRQPVLSTPIERVYLIGSGASVPYGLPTLKNLTRELAESLDEQQRAVLLEAVFECFNLNLEQCSDSPDFEELLNRLDLKALSYLVGVGLDNGLAFRKTALTLALSGLRDFIRHRCMEVADRIGPYDRLVTSLGDKTAIVSFNWDVLLEVALARAGRAYRYLPTRSSTIGTVLLKPHGSINWFALLDRELLMVTPDSNLAAFGDHIAYYLLYVTDPLAPIVFGNSTVEYALANVPAIVPPSASKLLDVGGKPRDNWVEFGHIKAIHNIWRTFKLMLDQASELVIIGYSLPGTDASSITLLKNYASERNSSSPKRVCLVEPNPAVAGRYEALLSTKVEIVSRDFGSFDPSVL